ncbi:MAG TPA: hypothetical protein VHX88_05500 [Solirubrobacteraceae bacterium]|nr:hypothetical protein [Solirubrobacteraceae bacterium]
MPAASGTYFGEAITGGDAYALENIPAFANVQPGTISMSPAGDIAYASSSGAVEVLSMSSGTLTQIAGEGGAPGGSLNNPSVAIDAAGDVAYAAGDGPEGGARAGERHVAHAGELHLR